MSQSKLRLVEDFVLGLDRRPQRPPSSDVGSPVHSPAGKGRSRQTVARRQRQLRRARRRGAALGQATSEPLAGWLFRRLRQRIGSPARPTARRHYPQGCRRRRGTSSRPSPRRRRRGQPRLCARIGSRSATTCRSGGRLQRCRDHRAPRHGGGTTLASLVTRVTLMDLAQPTPDEKPRL
jgi:hypothetical protein